MFHRLLAHLTKTLQPVTFQRTQLQLLKEWLPNASHCWRFVQRRPTHLVWESGKDRYVSCVSKDGHKPKKLAPWPFRVLKNEKLFLMIGHFHKTDGDLTRGKIFPCKSTTENGWRTRYLPCFPHWVFYCLGTTSESLSSSAQWESEDEEVQTSPWRLSNLSSGR